MGAQHRERLGAPPVAFERGERVDRPLVRDEVGEDRIAGLADRRQLLELLQKLRSTALRSPRNVSQGCAPNPSARRTPSARASALVAVADGG